MHSVRCRTRLLARFIRLSNVNQMNMSLRGSSGREEARRDGMEDPLTKVHTCELASKPEGCSLVRLGCSCEKD